MIQPDNDCNICYNEPGIYKCNNIKCSWKMCQECTIELINNNFKKCTHCQISTNFIILQNTSPTIKPEPLQRIEQQNNATITRQMYHSKWVTCQDSCYNCLIKICQNKYGFTIMLILIVLFLLIILGSISYIFTPKEKYNIVTVLLRGWIIFLFSLMICILCCVFCKYCVVHENETLN